MKSTSHNVAREWRVAKLLYGDLSRSDLQALKRLIQCHDVSVIDGDVIFLKGTWYVTHAGLLRVAERRSCAGIHCRPMFPASDPSRLRWVFRAVVFKSLACKGFVGYGDADPTNVSILVRGAEMRVAETRAVNRALRKAYGIGICSVEEIGSHAEPPQHGNTSPHPDNGSGDHPTVRDRLCHIIHRYRLDPNLVKAYLTDSCGVKVVRDATRVQIENFVIRLADWAEKDLDALRCQLNSYVTQKEEAA